MSSNSSTLSPKQVYMRQWRQNNKAHRARYEQQRVKRLRQEDPLKAKAVQMACSANFRYPGKLTAEDVLGLIHRTGRICYWCGKTDLSGRDLTIEHLQPVNDLQFVTIACAACNCGKRYSWERTPLSKDEIRLRGTVRQRRYYQENRFIVNLRRQIAAYVIRELEAQGYAVE